MSFKRATSFDYSFRRHLDVFTYRGTAIPKIIANVCVFTTYTMLLATSITPRNYWSLMSTSIISVLSMVTGLLLAFRLNNAYERYASGRIQWSTLTTTIRNFTRMIWFFTPQGAPTPVDSTIKSTLMRMLVGFAVAVKHHLRQESGLDHPDLQSLLPSSATSIKKSHSTRANQNAPLEVSYMITIYLRQLHQQNQIDNGQLASMNGFLNSMVSNLGEMERILTTPIPRSYYLHLKQILTLYCLALPPTLVLQLGFWAVPVMAIASFTFFGIEKISSEIENPFGHDPNDLPLDHLCAELKMELENLISKDSVDSIQWN
ncbi:UPF0187-domain-containing protein [Basidiobolus meristosporus CBS 931.73]|uniref:UPF0187-domain-containing protein n=1 Tax=Basidiobolus meristosporus CBS 931.73 TaxID=1314790 RepID=A0A1Y1XBV7_9FUNG|nr:UPF0187-domain-containing protein [Basidiobolus meristosporus CBS 931.73]|eukprot:ORX83203.1 UPF0187-domain-containing protein [Basidiobolus meristosporus CBS 931.73]